MSAGGQPALAGEDQAEGRALARRRLVVASALQQAGRHRAAAEAYRDAIAQGRGAPEVQNNPGIALLALGDAPARPPPSRPQSPPGRAAARR